MNIHLADNPFDGMSPNFNVFGVEFTHLWQVALAGVWGLGFVILAFLGIAAIVKAGQAKRAANVHGYQEALEDVKKWAISLVGLAALPVLFGAALALANG